MEDFFQFVPVIILLLITLLSVMRRQNRRRPEPEDVLDEEENGIFLPPWGNPELVEEENQPSLPVKSEEPPMEPQPLETPSQREDSTNDSEIHPSNAGSSGAQPPGVDTIAGISLSPQTVRQGIILSEILGRPKSFRRTRQ
jgi:hypothetical protein